jgi:hypothetical protein
VARDGKAKIMTRKTLTTTTKDLIVNTATVTIAAGAVTSLFSPDAALPPWAAVGLVAGALGTLAQYHRRPRRNWQQYASDARITIDRNGQQWLRWRDGGMKGKPSNEFLFSGLGLPATVTEKQMARFLGIAKRRDMKARYGFNEVRGNAILSHRHYTRNVQPPFLPAEYDAIMRVLHTTGRLQPPRPGHSGTVAGIGERVSTEMASDVAADWLQLLQGAAAPRRNLRSLFGLRRN